MADRDHGMPEAVVRPTDELYAVNSRLARGINITVSPETFEQYRTGYRCLACHHFPQPEPFPDRCVEPYCRYPMRRDQLAQLEFEYRGDEELWPTRTDEELRDELRGQGVWLPPD